MNKPNVILCLCDQLRPFELGCYGGKVVRTPHIDRLASEGMVFENAVTNNPVCVPARSCLLSGQYSRTCGGSVNNEHTDDYHPPRSRDRLKDKTITEYFQTMGYRTAVIGKWHTYPDPLVCGFEHALYPVVPHKYKGQTYFLDDGVGFLVEGYGPEYEMDSVKEYIVQNRNEPFFLHYNISLPHMPLLESVPDAYSSLYTKELAILRDNVPQNKKLVDEDLWYRIYVYSDFFRDYIKDTGKVNLFDKYPLPEDFDIRSLTALYYGVVVWVDDLVGRLSKVLDQNGISENTLLVFLSDHGDNLGSHGVFNKDRWYEESIRIPMVFRWPGVIRKGRNSHHLAQIIDVMPTLLNLAGITMPEHVQGRSLLPILANLRDELDGNEVFIETPFNEIAVRTPRFKYGTILSPETRKIVTGKECFYNMEQDPYEMVNLFNAGIYEDEKRELARKLEDWDRRTKWLKIG